MTTSYKKPSTSISTQSGRISCPIYVGIDNENAKQILTILRSKIETSETTSNLGVRVQDATIGSTQVEMEARLRCDLQTLRFVLFDSMSRGLPLDMAMRIQNELGDEFELISDKMLTAAWKNSISTYKHYAQTK